MRQTDRDELLANVVQIYIYVANITRDIRNPLTAMKGLLSMRLRFFPGDYSYFSAEAGVYAIGIFF